MYSKSTNYNNCYSTCQGKLISIKSGPNITKFALSFTVPARGQITSTIFNYQVDYSGLGTSGQATLQCFSSDTSNAQCVYNPETAVGSGLNDYFNGPGT